MLVLGKNSRPQPTRRRFAGKMRLEWQLSVRGTLRTTRRGCSEPNLCAARGANYGESGAKFFSRRVLLGFSGGRKSHFGHRVQRGIFPGCSAARDWVFYATKKPSKKPHGIAYTGGHLKIPRLSSPTTRFQRIQIPRRSAHIRSLYARSTEQIMTTSAVRRRGGQEDSSFQVQNTSRI
jgi:hypothetical protein